MKRLISPWTIVPLLLSGLFFCTPKKNPAPVAAILGSDTITVAQMHQLRPDALPDSVAATKVVTQHLLSKRCRTTISGGERDTLLEGLMKQLSLRSGVEWNRDAAGSLFDAACGLRALLDTAQSVEKVSAYLDSALSGIALAGGRKSGIAAPCRQPGAKNLNEVRFDSLLACVLGVSPEVGRTLEDFLRSASAPPKDNSKMSAMVKGLVFDASKAAKTQTVQPAEPVDNSEAVLKFRSLASIQDTIARHQANIRELYKKSLKVNTRMAGKVVIKFRVGADGSVMDAAIAATQIADKPFLEGLSTYARAIRFKPVPATAGNMSFEFPFEFSAEE